MWLTAIYNVYDAVELLPYSLRSIINHVNRVIIVYQNESNFGEVKDTRAELDQMIEQLGIDFESKIRLELFTPLEHSGGRNELLKRNLGLTFARQDKCTHFLFMDCDEIYEDFGGAKEEYLSLGAEGSVCQMYTYFKKPTLRLENVDNYYVPFIHSLQPETVAGYRKYPLYVDPTRGVNCLDVKLVSHKMHHYSYVRKDIEMKVRNSSARANIARSQLLNDYNNPELGAGYYLVDYKQKLVEVDNIFNIEI